MTAGFTAPAVFDGLVAVFSRVKLDGEVRDGEIPGDTAAREVISVGSTGPDDDSAAESGVVSGGIGPRERENYDVHCAVGVARGDNPLGPPRARAFELLNACRYELIKDPTVGGACMQAKVSKWVLRGDLTTGGAVLELRFDVHIDAFTAN